MVTIEKKDKSNYLISLSPNSSLEGIARIIFLASITFVCGGIAIIFYFFGAFMILPFAGIELTILFIAFYIFSYALLIADNSKFWTKSSLAVNNECLLSPDLGLI